MSVNLNKAIPKLSTSLYMVGYIHWSAAIDDSFDALSPKVPGLCREYEAFHHGRHHEHRKVSKPGRQLDDLLGVEPS